MKKIIFPVFVLLVLFLAGCQTQTITKYQCENGQIVDSIDLCSGQQIPDIECSNCQIEEGMAILDVEVYDWGYNEYNEDELLFDYWISNYGDIEAKNIVVRCKLIGDENKIKASVIDNYGNLASKSTELGEFTPEKPSTYSDDEEYAPICYVESCGNNCHILYKEIPDLVETYGET